ncbi:MAG: MATE family efflux transporter, partial [Clostridia bacterium]|nr:MATE family efflux transporter [Clostridia bacterium]
MTEGSIVKNLVKFALPLLLGNMFQQLYNMVDTYVIGQTGDISAYAAVGSVGPIINILIGFFLGFSAGAGVVISQYFGAGDKDKV